MFTNGLQNDRNKQFPKLLLGLMFCFVTLWQTAQAALPTMERQDLSGIKRKIEEFLLTQSAGYPGKVSVMVGAIDPHLKLAECASMEVFLPSGSRAWGKTSVGVRCNAPVLWTIYVQSKVTVNGNYVVAAAPLMQGHVITKSDVMTQEGDLTSLPPGIFTDADHAVGRTVSLSLVAGSVLRQEVLKQSPVVQQGQTVLLMTSGAGFSVTTEGMAMNNANEGKVVQVKVQSGQIVSGIARSGGKVEVGY